MKRKFRRAHKLTRNIFFENTSKLHLLKKKLILCSYKNREATIIYLSILYLQKQKIIEMRFSHKLKYLHNYK